MDRIYNISEIRAKKYEINFPVGEIIYNYLFKQVVIDNDLDNFFNIQLGQEWSFMTMKEAMESGVEQVLITWVSNTDNNDVNLLMITIRIGLNKKVTYDFEYNERISYSIYYQVVNTELENISEKLKTFNEAFRIFKKKITGFIAGLEI